MAAKSKAIAELCSDLRKTLVEFINDLRQNVLTEPREVGDLNLVSFFLERLNDEALISNVTKNILPYEKQITARDHTFFIKNRSIFQGMDEKTIDYFAGLWKPESNRLSQEDRDCIWAYMDTIIAIANNYKKNK